MADEKWSAFPSTTSSTAGDVVVGLHSSDNSQFVISPTPANSAIVLWDANSNLSANNMLPGYLSTPTAGALTILTASSAQEQYATGTLTQTYQMAVTSTLKTGFFVLFYNNSSANVTLTASDTSSILIMTPNTSAKLTCISTGVTTSAAWDVQYALNSLAPTLANTGLATTGTPSPNDVPTFTFYNASTSILGTYYPNILFCTFNPASILGATTINFGKAGYLTLFTLSALNTTTVTGNSVLYNTGITLALAPLLTSISFNSMLICGGITITSANALTSFSLPALLETGAITITSATSLTTFSIPNAYNCFGVITGTANALTTLTLTNLQLIFGNYSLTANALTTLSMPALINIGYVATSTTGNFAPVGTLLATVNMPNLVTVNGTFSPTLAALTSLTLTALTTVVGAFGLTAATLTTLSLPALTTCSAGFTPVCALATTVTLTNLTVVTGSFGPSFAVLTTLSLPAITNITTTIAISAPMLTTFTMNSGLLQVGGNVTMTGMALNQASVDGILVRLAALDGTGGTTTYSSHTVNLSGGTSSAPSATGLAAKATLVARSCTVTTN